MTWPEALGGSYERLVLPWLVVCRRHKTLSSERFLFIGHRTPLSPKLAPSILIRLGLVSGLVNTILPPATIYLCMWSRTPFLALTLEDHCSNTNATSRTGTLMLLVTTLVCAAIIRSRLFLDNYYG